MPEQQSIPFATDGEYLTEEATYLATLARRITNQQRLRDLLVDDLHAQDRVIGTHEPTAVEACRCNIEALIEQERDLRHSLDQRLTAHRADPQRFRLGLDVVCEEHALPPEARTLLAVATICACSKEVGEQIVDGPGWSFYGGPTVENLYRILGATSLDSRLRLRSVFPPLIRNGLIAVDVGRSGYPEDRLGSRVYITSAAFVRITGLAPEDEGWLDGAQSSGRRARQG